MRFGYIRVLWVVLAFSASGAAEPSLKPPSAGAPSRILFTPSRIAALRARFPAERSSREAWERLQAAADQVAPPRDGTAGTARRARATAAEIPALALALAMTGESRYAAALRDFLLADLARSNWGEPDLARRDPPWQATLATARDCFTAAIAFDAVRGWLSDAERRQIANGIVRLGIRPTLEDWIEGDRRIHSLDTMGHNWWSACVFSAGTAAIAVADDIPAAHGWLRRIDEATAEWFGYGGSRLENKPANFDPEGAFYESVNYSAFGLSCYLYFRLAWTDAFGAAPADLPLLDRAGDYFLDVAYPNHGPMMTLDFGDGSLHADGSQPLCLLWANGYRRPEYLWYLNAARTTVNREGMDRNSALGLVFFPADAELARAPASCGLPPSHLFGGMGWGMLRSSWKPDATLLGVKSGYTWNHSHADEGSFILFHGGEPLLIDSGNCSYNWPAYDAYYRQSLAHNVILFNGHGEEPEDTYYGSKFPGSVSELFDTGDLKYLLADATGPNSRYFRRDYRHFLWLGDVILVIDDVEAFEPGRFEWLLHVGGPAVRRGLDLVVTRGKAEVRVRPLFPEPLPDGGLPADFPEKMRLEERVGFADHEPDTKVPYYAFVPAEPARRTKFITAITLVTDANRDRLPEITRREGGNWIGVRMRQQGKTADVYLNLLADQRIRHRNANATIEGVETDAYLLAFAGGRTFVADGSYLRQDGQVRLDSLSKVFATWTEKDGKVDLEVHGQPNLNLRVEGTEFHRR